MGTETGLEKQGDAMPERVSDSVYVVDDTGRSRLDLRTDGRLAELVTGASRTV
jgi:hypothetical protein